MSKRSKRKKQRATGGQPTKLLLSLRAVRMLKDALRLVDEAFTRITQPLPNLEFGLGTLANLRQKLDDMLQGEDWDTETPFDYNELQILYAAIHMYLVDLTLNNNQQLIPMCLQLCKQLSRAVETIPPERIKPQRDN